MATITKCNIEQTIGLIDPKIKALFLTIVILFTILIMATITYHAKGVIDPTIGMIGPKPEALVLMVKLVFQSFA